VEPPTARVESRPGVTVEEVETFEGRSHALTGIGADPDGDTVTYQWSQAAAVGGARVSIQSPTTARSSFVMPEVRAPGGRAVHTVRLTVTDSVRLSGFHEVRFVVKDTSPPRPHAGFDQQVTVSSTDSAPNRFALDGGLSRDARGGSFTDRLRYTWEEVDGAASNRPVADNQGSLIPGGVARTVRVTLDVPTTLTTHHFRLTTRDIFTERQAQDWVTVIVRPPAEVEIAVTGTTSIRDGVFTPLPDGGEQDAAALRQWLDQLQRGLNEAQPAGAAWTLEMQPGDDFCLLIKKNVHGHERTDTIHKEFFQSDDFAAIRKLAARLWQLFNGGACVVRGDAREQAERFDEAVDWLFAQAQKGLSIQRYKGLGEMNPEQLWETTMDPATRRLMQVQIPDGADPDGIFSTLMGGEVEPRREFIEQNALAVSNLDI